MIECAAAADVPFHWVTGDEVYGNHRPLHLWLEQQQIWHVLALALNQYSYRACGKSPYAPWCLPPLLSTGFAGCRGRYQGASALWLGAHAFAELADTR
jgi:hypothetical protein